MTPQLLLECVKNNIKNKSSDNVSWGSANHVNEFYQLKKNSNSLIEDACHAIGSNYIINKKNTMLVQAHIQTFVYFLYML